MLDVNVLSTALGHLRTISLVKKDVKICLRLTPRRALCFAMCDAEITQAMKTMRDLQLKLRVKICANTNLLFVLLLFTHQSTKEWLPDYFLTPLHRNRHLKNSKHCRERPMSDRISDVRIRLLSKQAHQHVSDQATVKSAKQTWMFCLGGSGVGEDGVGSGINNRHHLRF